MALTPLTKKTYVARTTPVSSSNINAAQDAIIELQNKSLITDAQTLASEKKTQVRTNLGVVGYDAQTLTDAQKTQAAANIGITLSDIGKLMKLTGGEASTASINDFNNLLDTGIWYCEGLENNKPSSTTYYLVIVIRIGSNMVKQIAMNATTNHLYIRGRNQNGVWSDWHTVF